MIKFVLVSVSRKLNIPCKLNRHLDAIVVLGNRDDRVCRDPIFRPCFGQLITNPRWRVRLSTSDVSNVLHQVLEQVGFIRDRNIEVCRLTNYADNRDDNQKLKSCAAAFV